MISCFEHRVRMQCLVVREKILLKYKRILLKIVKVKCLTKTYKKKSVKERKT